MVLRIILVRHGESEDNLNKVNGGHSATPLTSEGKLQASKVAECLKHEHIDVFYVSDLPRTLQTAAPVIARHPAARVIHEPRLRERFLGALEGSPHGTVLRKAVEAGVPYVDFVPPGGESIHDFKKRVRSFVDTVILPLDGTVAVVSHGGVITHMLLHFQHLENTAELFDAHHPKNAAISLVEVEDGVAHIRVLNMTEHLGW